MSGWEQIVLAGWERGQRLSAVGPGPVQAHLDHAERLVQHLGPAERALDLGCGVGIPGLALAGLRPEVAWTLLDASKRRIELVREIVDELDWADRVTVVHGRAEDRRLGLPPFDLVVARLFGPPATTAECAAPLVRVGGQIVVTEPPEVEALPDGGERWPDAGLAALGLRAGPRRSDPAVQILDAVRPPEARFPRKPGVAAKRPLW